MAFGLLVNKWRVFKRQLAVDFVNCGLVIKTCMKLHNFCIDERIREADTRAPASAVLQEFNALEECTYSATESEIRRHSRPELKNGHLLRQVVMEHIQNYNLARQSSTQTISS